MKLNRIKLTGAPRSPLLEDDRQVLDMIFQSRIRTFVVVFGIFTAYVLYKALPYLLSHDMTQFSAGICAFVLIIIAPGLLVFFLRIWPYRRDLQAGFKFVVYEQVIDKKYFPITGQYFLSLEDVNYMHHEVEESVWLSVNIGDRYPVYFAAHSHYAFNLRGRITMM